MSDLVTLLIGHRGTGKTSFLRGLAAFARAHELDVTCWDLDEEIERAEGSPLAEIFARGEEHFRKVEDQTLAALLVNARGTTFIAVGAGFEGPIPEDVQVIWLRRTSDASGRSFTNRPRLNRTVSPFVEYQERFATRSERYAAWATQELLLPEGYAGGLEGFVFGEPVLLPYALTLLAENFHDWSGFLKRHTGWEVSHWELRDDLLSEEQIELALETLPPEKILYAQRRSSQRPEDVRVDWALELGEPPSASYSLSLHEREEDFTSTLAKLSVLAWKSDLLKLAVEVKDFTELRQGHQWWLQDPTRRSFLPRSPDGRWRWYRSLFGPRMPLHFIREGDGSALDQPPLWQALLQPAFKEKFAAVLGAPVEHSRTPLEHADFFAKRQIPVVAIAVPEVEFPVALEFLRELGLAFAAVTAPLKKVAWASATSLTPEARQMQAANTLALNGHTIAAHNTDVLALRELSGELGEFENVWLWGGGGVKTSLKAAWPKAHEVSARNPQAPTGTPDLLVWATGRHRALHWPEVRPRLVLDLNYSDDSPGLEWAARENLPYQSGLRMFKLQAAHQRSFWQEESR